MDRRFLTVLAVSLIFALIVATIFYKITSGTSTAKVAPPQAWAGKYLSDIAKEWKVDALDAKADVALEGAGTIEGRVLHATGAATVITSHEGRAIPASA